MKDERLYAKFTLDFPDHPKILCLSTEAKWALVDLTIYSRRHMTDGFIPKAVALAKHGLDVCQELATNDVENPSLIELDSGFQIHDFALHQSTKAEIEALTDKRRRAGQKGGQARAKASAKQVLKQNASKIKPETETETETERDQKTSSPATPPTLKYPAPFEEWWAHYPRKTDKGGALKAWEKARRKVGDQRLLDGVVAFAEDPNLPEAGFIPHASTWLNGSRWDDGPLPPRGGGRHPDEQRNGWDELRPNQQQIGA